MCWVNFVGGFIRPDRHTRPIGLQSLNGSDQNGGCAVECVMNDVCDCTSSSVQITSALINGVYPSGMIDTSGTNWASDFFTVNRNGGSTVRTGFQWSARLELRGVELKLFNCASEGTAIHTINVYASMSFPLFPPLNDPPGLTGSYLTTAW